MNDWLWKLGFVREGEPRKPTMDEWYINKNTNDLCFVYDDASKPCDCPKCGEGKRQIVVPRLS